MISGRQVLPWLIPEPGWERPFWRLIIGLLAWLLGEAVRLVGPHHARSADGQGGPGRHYLPRAVGAGSVWLVRFFPTPSLVPALEKLLGNPTLLPSAAFYAVVVGLVAWLAGGPCAWPCIESWKSGASRLTRRPSVSWVNWPGGSLGFRLCLLCPRHSRRCTVWAPPG